MNRTSIRDHVNPTCEGARFSGHLLKLPHSVYDSLEAFTVSSAGRQDALKRGGGVEYDKTNIRASVPQHNKFNGI